ncbi:hypothetical protein [Embleya sp. AB8]|uniref:hypothetical protein n=1 Tax=Embleya sp. AB8 TaxID=3156304 RepID=UPI003C76F0AA
MNRLIWLQHRGQVLWLLATLVALAGWLLFLDHLADGDLSAVAVQCDLGSGQVRHVCGPFVDDYRTLMNTLATGLPAFAVVCGALLGAPLVAREIEQRTHLVAWSQSVSRRRWYTTKVAAVGGCLVLAGAVTGTVAYRLEGTFGRGGSITRWPWFHAMGFSPAVDALVAFAFGVTAGAVLRRTLPALAVSLVGTLAVILGIGGPFVAAGSDDDSDPFWLYQFGYAGIGTAVAVATLVAGWFATRRQTP